MSTMAHVPGGAPPKKKVHPLIWVLVGVVGLFLVVGVLLVVGGIFVAKKIADNPALVAATAIAAANPDVEIVSSDSDGGTVTFRDKSSGKTVTLDFDQIKQGRLVFSEDGKEVSLEAGESGIHLKSSDGKTVEIGTNAKLPSWIPTYPGATIEGTFSSTGGSEETASASFKTSDPAERVIEFYAGRFRDEGMEVNQTTHQQSGKLAGGVVTAQSEDRTRQAGVTISVDRNEVSGVITYTSKK